MPYYLYIIYSETLDKYYVGQTEDLDRRLSEHLAGISTYTSKAKDWTLKYTESFDSREAAFRREQEIKRKKSRKYIEWLISK
ncbi:GIY-YIG nuclease family protein [Mucilaginibacter sp. RS28]|uniref:GIY-YIG nuclease family protein n=1 Tax=Mucilaginibacter straminoryzae TaxID=2932774 RepID=A0A9X1X4M9_9SPHI|nr:GIY-YIG nuclease family protein [Mucilaginibacter straminoryzae]MCJ8210335.1 GIY-YIG nuclease family protein [Mucilaginibacter straminoryzae]